MSQMHWLAIAATAMIALSVPAAAQQSSLSGTWNGGGSIELPSGATERARCRATFQSSGNGATMSATCATPSAKIYQQAELTRVSGNRFVGDFRNPEYGITGSIRITVRGNSLSAALNGGGGSASFSLSR